MKEHVIALICAGKLNEALDVLFKGSKISNDIDLHKSIIVLLYEHSMICRRRSEIRLDEEIRHLNRISLKALEFAYELDAVTGVCQ